MEQESLFLFSFVIRASKVIASRRLNQTSTVRMEQRLCRARAGVMDSAATLSFC
jgi:hypothetical protein